MFCYTYLVLLSMVVAGQSAVLPGELCAQNPEWKRDVCIHINNSEKSSRALCDLLETRKTSLIQNDIVPDTQNVSSIEHFFQELLKYSGTLNRLHSSMKAYMSTPRFSTESSVARDGDFAISYGRRITETISALNQTIENMSEVVRLTASQDKTIEVDTKKTSRDIYLETFDAACKLKLLVQTWEHKCAKC